MGKMGYRASLDWILDNDDTEWLHDEYGSASVTLLLVAAIFNIDPDKAERDLRRRDTNRRVAEAA